MLNKYTNKHKICKNNCKFTATKMKLNNHLLLKKKISQ